MPLNNPFPFPNRKQKIGTALFLSGYVYLFLTIFEPFGISEIEFKKPLILMGYGIITLVISLLMFYLAPLLFPHYFEKEQWTVKKSFVFVFWELLFIAILNWLYTASFDIEIIGRELTFFHFIFYTIAVGVLAISFLIILGERWMNFRNQLRAEKWTLGLPSKGIVNINKNELVTIGKEKNQLQVIIQNLLCIKSDGNYLEIYFLDQEQVAKTLIRFPLSQVNQQLEKYTFIKQCHRSFIINLDHVEKVSGNARNYSIHLQFLDFPIPVSRQFPKENLDSIQN